MLDLLKKKTKVILDTNFLFVPGELGVDIFSEIERLMNEPYEICVIQETVDELQNLIVKYGKKKEGFNAKLGFIMIKQKGLKTLPSSTSEYADDAILSWGRKNPKKTIVATQDKELRKKLRDDSIRVIELKQKGYLTLR